MHPILLWPDPPPHDIVRVLDLAGISWETVSGEAAAREQLWSGAVISAEEDPAAAYTMARTLRKGDLAIAPLLLCVRSSELGDLEGRHDVFDDFCVVPAHPVELEARIRHLLASEGTGIDLPPEVITYESLELNVETYQAAIDGRPLDLTFMEYELLKFLASDPGRVFTREILLSRVWGYEYYGGARTVDVHIRRLRAKLGEEHAGLIQTVRSVGYRFGQSRWGT
ncbi:MAG: response regulator transcription factor [Microthrixaceae bacterium]|nr:response regulator transcription factor [Microthrixaceae bacterium]